MFDTAVFDLDGTLLNTLEDIEGSVNYVLRELGCEQVSVEKVRQSVGNGSWILMEKVLPGGRENPLYERSVHMQMQYYQEHCRILTRPYDGILPVMAQLKNAGVAMAIVSNKGDGAVRELAGHYFSKLVSGAVGERPGIRRKPAPDTVFEAIRQMGRNPEKTVYVGDSEVDYETALQAGIPCILVSWGFRGRKFLEEQFHPEYLIDRPEELLSFFGV